MQVARPKKRGRTIRKKIEIITDKAKCVGLDMAHIEWVMHRASVAVKRDIGNKTRNRTIVKSVLEKRGGANVVIAESDDVILHFDANFQEVVYWSIKSREKQYSGRV